MSDIPKKSNPAYQGKITEGQVWLIEERIRDSDGQREYLNAGEVVEVLKTFDYSTPAEPVVVLRVELGTGKRRERVRPRIHLVERRALEAQQLVADPLEGKFFEGSAA